MQAIEKQVNTNKVKGQVEEPEVEDKLQIIIQTNHKVAEAIAALQVLGYNKKEIEKAFIT